jgi:hypothetical protein
MKRTEPYSRLHKRSKAARARLYLDRVKQFLRLPACYRKMRAIKDCKRSRLGLALDLLVLFFSHKTFPNHYGVCRLWEVDKAGWAYYYHFTLYSPHHKARLFREVQPYVYRILFDDKYLTAMHCKALGIRMPNTYGTIDPSQEYSAQIQAWLHLSSAQALFIKPIIGGGGRDAVIARKTGNDIIIRSAKASMPLRDYVLRERSIVQEKLSQDSRMAAVSSSSVNTLRMVTMLTKHGDIIIVNAAIRFGVGESIVDNYAAGGVAAGVDCETGKLRKYAYDKKGNRYLAHPTTGVIFEDFIVPEWKRICHAAREIQRAFLFYRMLGLDMGLDESGEPVLIEINGTPDLVFIEHVCGPLLKSRPVLQAFGEDDVLVNRHQRRLYSRLKSQS